MTDRLYRYEELVPFRLAEKERRESKVGRTEMHRPADLRRAVLAPVLCGSSFSQLACWSVMSGIASMSEAAWRRAASSLARGDETWLAGNTRP